MKDIIKNMNAKEVSNVVRMLRNCMDIGEDGLDTPETILLAEMVNEVLETFKETR